MKEEIKNPTKEKVKEYHELKLTRTRKEKKTYM